jgi:hypothetical protein
MEVKRGKMTAIFAKIIPMGTGLFELKLLILGTALASTGILQWLNVQLGTQLGGLAIIALVDSVAGAIAANQMGHRVTSSRWEIGVARKAIVVCLLVAIAALEHSTPHNIRTQIPTELALSSITLLFATGWIYSILENLALIGGLPRPVQAWFERNVERAHAETKPRANQP